MQTVTRDACEVVCRTKPFGDWLEARRMGVGASEVATILGVTGSPLDVYADKLGLTEIDTERSESAEWGLLLEPVVAKELARRRKMECEAFDGPDGAELLRSRRYPWLQATPDAYLGHRLHPLQVKTRSAYKEKDWEEGVPLPVVIQVTAEMLVVGAEQATVACLIGGQKLVWQDLALDPELAATILLATEQFWKDVQDRKPPAAGVHGAALAAVKAVWPKSSGETMTMSHDAESAVIEWRRLAAIRLDAEKQEKVAQARIREEMQSAEIGLLPGGGFVTLKEQSQPAKTTAACTFRVLRYKEAK